MCQSNKQSNDFVCLLSSECKLLLFILQDKESMLRLSRTIDKAGGYIFGGEEDKNDMASMMSCAVGADFEFFRYPFLYSCQSMQDSSGSLPTH